MAEVKTFFKNVEIHWGFPVEARREGEPEGSRRSRGIALLMAIMVIATIIIFTADMIVTSSVNLQMAATNRDRIKAEYLAKSGVNLAIFLISADLGMDLLQFQQDGKTPPSDGTSDIWSLMNGLPIGGQSLEMLSAASEEFNLSKVNDKGVLDQLGQFDGEFAVMVEDEARKLNVNFCGDRATECLAMLEGLMSCPAEKEFLEKKKLNPRELAANIKDWVDKDNRPVEGWSSSGSEEAPYDRREPKVSPKNAPMDSLEELKQVAGWDDDLHKVFSPFLTVFPVAEEGTQAKPKVNLNTASRELLTCLMPQTITSCAEQSVKFTNPAKAEDEPADVASPADIQKRLAEAFCENDANKAKWFTYRTDTFRVEAAGTVGEQVVSLQTVIKRGLPDSVEEKDGFGGSYRFLYWKML